MSTVLYAKGTLVTDGGFTNRVGYHRENIIFSSSNNSKIGLSKNRHVAIGFVGDTLNISINELSDIVEEHLLKHRSLLCNDDFNKAMMKICNENHTEMSFIVMENIVGCIYDIDINDNSDNGKLVISINTLKNDDVVALGTGTYYALIAYEAGLTAIDAVRFSIKYDKISRYPIQFINMDQLTVFTEESDE